MKGGAKILQERKERYIVSHHESTSVVNRVLGTVWAVVWVVVLSVPVAALLNWSDLVGDLFNLGHVSAFGVALALTAVVAFWSALQAVKGGLPTDWSWKNLWVHVLSAAFLLLSAWLLHWLDTVVTGVPLLS